MTNGHYSFGYTPDYDAFLEAVLNPDLKKYYIPEGNEYGKDR